MTTTIRLFCNETLEHYLTSRRASLDGFVNDLTQLEELRKVAEIVARGRVEKLTLVRREATFDITEPGDAVVIDMRIPLEGNTALLRLSPPVDPATTVSATIDDRRWILSEPSKPTLGLSESFKVGTSLDEVKAWAKTEVDAIVRTLGYMDQMIDEHNTGIETHAQTLIEKRRAVLSTGKTLRDGLQSGGI